jgi:hypothetical protein
MFEVIHFPSAKLEREKRWKHSFESFSKTLTAVIAAEVRFRMQVVPEKRFICGQDLRKALFIVFMLVDVGEYDPAGKGDCGFAVVGRIS